LASAFAFFVRAAEEVGPSWQRHAADLDVARHMMIVPAGGQLTDRSHRSRLALRARVLVTFDVLGNCCHFSSPPRSAYRTGKSASQLIFRNRFPSDINTFEAQQKGLISGADDVPARLIAIGKSAPFAYRTAEGTALPVA
jgi:hypothetical protein